MKGLRVVEIKEEFVKSGRYKGQEATVVRVTEKEKIPLRDISVIEDGVAKRSNDKVLLTGHEPLIRRFVGLMLEDLWFQNYFTILDTSGKYDIGWMACVQNFMVHYDYKGQFHPKNLFMMRKQDDLIFDVWNDTSYEAVKGIVKGIETDAQIWLRLRMGHDKDNRLKKKILRDNLDVSIC